MNFSRKPIDTSRVQIPKGVVHIFKDRCKGCTFCVAYCPVDVLKMSKKFNHKGYYYPEAAPNVCVDCGFCQLVCPEFAIFSTQEKQLI